jgi:hypothetical protein
MAVESSALELGTAQARSSVGSMSRSSVTYSSELRKCEIFGLRCSRLAKPDEALGFTDSGGLRKLVYAECARDPVSVSTVRARSICLSDCVRRMELRDSVIVSWIELLILW